MTNLEKIKDQLENSLKRQEKALAKLQGGNMEEKAVEELSKEIATEKKLARRINRECIRRRVRQFSDLAKKHPKAYSEYLAMNHRGPRK